MKITVVARNIDIYEAQSERIRKKVERAIGKYPDKLIKTTVILSVEGHQINSEINIKAKSVLFHATEKGDDIRTALEASVKKVMTQMRRHKDRVKTRRGR